MKFKYCFRVLFPLAYPKEKIIFLHEIGSFLYRNNLQRMSMIIEYIILRKFNCAISSQSVIDRTIKLPHPIGIVIGAGVVIEENVTVYQNVTIGRRNTHDSKYPIVKKNSIIYSNAVLIGDGIIEENTVIGANTTVNFSTEKSSVYVGNKARRIK